MKNNIRNLCRRNLLIVVSLILFFGCKKEQNSFLIVKPLDILSEAFVDDIITFTIEGSSDINFESLTVSIKPQSDYSIVVLDTNLSDVNKFLISWEFKVPVFPDEETKTKLSFVLTKSDNTTLSDSRILMVKNNAALDESTGHELFSTLAENSNAFDAFSFIDNSPLHSELSDSTIMHIKENTDTNMVNGTLGLKWTSPAEAEFVRFNDFDFGNANQTDLILSFKAGLSSPFINNLKSQDIILVKYPAKNNNSFGYAAVKIVSIIDDDGVESDRYIFDVKK